MNPSFYISGGIVVVVIVMFFFLGVLLLLNFIANIDEKKKLANCISICKAVLSSRIFLILLPIMYVVFIFVHIMGCLVLMVLIMFNGSFNSQLNIIAFEYMNSSFEIVTDAIKISTLVITVLFCIHGIFFYTACLRYAISNMAFIWYQDRAEFQGTVESKNISILSVAREPKTQ